MIPQSVQTILALALDQLLGDPRWFPHPVRLIGWLQLRLESVSRALLPWPRLAGVVTVACTLLVVALVVGGGLFAAGQWSPWLADGLAVFVLYTCFAGRDLERHGRAVQEALQQDDLLLARQRVAMIVGRDTAELSEEEVARAAVESVAESLVDGVTAPIFYAMIAGPLGAMLYKAVNTGDSMFGYKNEQYREFGWAAARLDDLLNYIPARLTGLCLPLAAFFLGLRAKKSWQIMVRDHANHASPNSGFPEAAMAGALHVRLGGSASYFGRHVEKPTMGDGGPVQARHIGQAIALMRLSMVLVTILLVLAGFLG